jgi:hypothetical protein
VATVLAAFGGCKKKRALAGFQKLSVPPFTIYYPKKSKGFELADFQKLLANYKDFHTTQLRIYSL